MDKSQTNWKRKPIRFCSSFGGHEYSGLVHLHGAVRPSYRALHHSRKEASWREQKGLLHLRQSLDSPSVPVTVLLEMK